MGEMFDSSSTRSRELKIMGACVSVIIPTYNKGDLVKKSLESLLKQTYGDWKAIVVDDCSSDESWDVIQAYVKKI